MRLIYEGKAKQLFETDNENEILITFKDDATAFNAQKKASIAGKAKLNNRITELLFNFFEKNGIETHFIKKVDELSQLVKKVEIIPLEVIIRNISAGSFSKRYGQKDGIVFKRPSFEVSYKKDELNDPLMAKDHVLALDIINEEEWNFIKNESLKINDLLKKLFLSMNIKLVDFKIEFGKLPNGKIILADEFSPDNARLWDKDTNKKLDKDNFRQDIGSLTDAYSIVLERLENVI